MVSPTIQQTTPATLYVRWSSEQQTGRDSLRRQLEAAQRYADEHRLVIVETIIDEAVSAFSGHHLTKGRLGDFIRRVEDHAVTIPHTLICESLDRLNRQSPLDALLPFIGLINAGITLVTLTDGQHFTRQSMADDGGLRLLTSLIVMLRAHEESATKSKRVGAAWERKRREASVHKLTKTCPAWLRLTPDRGRFEVIPDRAEVVRLMFEETAAGIGKGSVAARLNAAGVPPFRGKHGWHASYIQKVLASGAVIGTYQPHRMEGGRRVPAGPPVPDYFPAVVDPDLRMKARAAVIARRSGAGGRKGAGFRNILSGIARCAACGSGMAYVGKGDGEGYLACSSARRRRGCNARAHFNFNEAERQFLANAPRFNCSGGPALREMREALRRAEAATGRLSDRLNKLLDAFMGDTTAEVVAAAARARDDLRLARLEQERLSEGLVLAEYGGGLAELRSAIAQLQSLSADADLPSLFASRARVAHAARAAGVTATCHERGRLIEVRCVGCDEAFGFSCQPIKTIPRRDPLGRFAQQVSQGDPSSDDVQRMRKRLRR
jgi:DNA invertase Pin-like site-specific DNA recombinase